MKRAHGYIHQPSRTRGHRAVIRQSEDIELPVSPPAPPFRPDHQFESPGNARRRPAVRTGGRVRMDAASSTRGAARSRPVPGAPRYRRNRKPTDWRKVIGTGLLAALVVAGVVWLFTTPKLAIKEVRIEGVTPELAASLQSQIAHPAIAHNLLGYLALHGRALQRQMATAEPQFESARIGVASPHTLTVTIVNRKPFALLAQGPNQSWILDERGVPILPGANHPAGLMKILFAPPLPGQSPLNAVLGKPLPADQADSIQQAYALMNVLKSRADGASVHVILIDNSQNLCLNMNNILRVKLGQATDLSEKLALIDTILNQHPELSQEAQYIDVSYPARPAWKPKNVDAKGNPVAPQASQSAAVASGPA